MPLAVTHILFSIICVDLYKKFFATHKKLFTKKIIFIAGISALLPDLDIPLRMFFRLIDQSAPLFYSHGGITHTAFFALFFLIPAIIYFNLKDNEKGVLFSVISFGIFSHLLLDYLIGGGAEYGVMWFFPLSLTAYKIHLLLNLGLSDLPMAMDAIFLLAWIYYESIKNKIVDFI